MTSIGEQVSRRRWWWLADSGFVEAERCLVNIPQVQHEEAGYRGANVEALQVLNEESQLYICLWSAATGIIRKDFHSDPFIVLLLPQHCDAAYDCRLWSCFVFRILLHSNVSNVLIPIVKSKNW